MRHITIIRPAPGLTAAYKARLDACRIAGHADMDAAVDIALEIANDGRSAAQVITRASFDRWWNEGRTTADAVMVRTNHGHVAVVIEQ